MKKINFPSIFSILVISALIFSCNSGSKYKIEFADNLDSVIEASDNMNVGIGIDYNEEVDNYSGHWEGKIDNLDFILQIENKGDNIFSGKNSAGENERPVEGKVDKSGQLLLTEPGDQLYDGSFVLWFEAQSGLLKGSWTSKDGKLESSIVACKVKEEGHTAMLKAISPPEVETDGWKLEFDRGQGLGSIILYIPTENQTLPKKIAGTDDILNPVNIDRTFILRTYTAISTVHNPGEEGTYEKKTFIKDAILSEVQ